MDLAVHAWWLVSSRSTDSYPLAPANVGVHARQQLLGHKWLVYEVVRAGLETSPLGGRIGLTTQQQHRHLFEACVSSQLAAHLQTILPDQPDVQQDHIGQKWRGQCIEVRRVAYRSQ